MEIFAALSGDMRQGTPNFPSMLDFPLIPKPGIIGVDIAVMQAVSHEFFFYKNHLPEQGRPEV
jgi:hypothetical protein